MREAEILPFHEDELPTDAGVRSTGRPPSRHDETPDQDTLMGRVMGEVVGCREDVNALRSAWAVQKRDFETGLRDISQMRRDMAELLSAQGRTSRHLKVATRAAPFVIGAIEIGRTVFAHYFGGS